MRITDRNKGYGNSLKSEKENDRSLRRKSVSANNTEQEKCLADKKQWRRQMLAAGSTEKGGTESSK